VQRWRNIAIATYPRSAQPDPLELKIRDWSDQAHGPGVGAGFEVSALRYKIPQRRNPLIPLSE
jgi:hypothetical protein